MAELLLLLGAGAAGTASAATGAGIIGAAGAGTAAAATGIGSGLLSAAGTAAAGLGAQSLLAKKAGTPTMPTLQDPALAPLEKSPGIMDETGSQLDALTGKGRKSTILSKKKKKKEGYLDDDGGTDFAPSYTNTSLGG